MVLRLDDLQLRGPVRRLPESPNGEGVTIGRYSYFWVRWSQHQAYERISGEHCRIRENQVSEGNVFYTVEDLGSSNKTFVNGHEIEDETPLKSGDILTLGYYKYEVIIGEE